MLSATLLAAVALLVPSPPAQTATAGASRRDVFIGAAAALIAVPAACTAAEGVVLTDAEMEARIARKIELQKAQARGVRPGSGGGGVSSNGGVLRLTDEMANSDVNPEAGVNLRARSIVDNAKESIRRQDELKKRDKKQKRDDMCEMLGRGC